MNIRQQLIQWPATRCSDREVASPPTPLQLPDLTLFAYPLGERAVSLEGRALVGRTLAEVERDLIQDTLNHCIGNRTRAADLLKISIWTLRNKLHEYAADGFSIPPPAAPRHEIRNAAAPRWRKMFDEAD